MSGRVNGLGNRVARSFDAAEGGKKVLVNVSPRLLRVWPFLVILLPLSGASYLAPYLLSNDAHHAQVLAGAHAIDTMPAPHPQRSRCSDRSAEGGHS